MVAVRIRPEIEHPTTRPLIVLDEPVVAQPPRRARRDALPEHTHYADTGCDLHESCLTCPLVRCRYDEPGGARKLVSSQRDRSIIALQQRGVLIDTIARRFGISRRTVFRVLARTRGAAIASTK